MFDKVFRIIVPTAIRNKFSHIDVDIKKYVRGKQLTADFNIPDHVQHSFFAPEDMDERAIDELSRMIGKSLKGEIRKNIAKQKNYRYMTTEYRTGFILMSASDLEDIATEMAKDICKKVSDVHVDAEREIKEFAAQHMRKAADEAAMSILHGEDF